MYIRKNTPGDAMQNDADLALLSVLILDSLPNIPLNLKKDLKGLLSRQNQFNWKGKVDDNYHESVNFNAKSKLIHVARN